MGTYVEDNIVGTDTKYTNEILTSKRVVNFFYLSLGQYSKLVGYGLEGRMNDFSTTY